MFLFKESCLNCKIPVNSTLKDAVEALEKGTLKIALVIDENNSLKGTVCDGDIRRALLKGFSARIGVFKHKWRFFYDEQIFRIQKTQN